MKKPLRSSNPRARFVYMPGDGDYLAGVLINRSWKGLSPGMRRTTGSCIKRLLHRNQVLRVFDLHTGAGKVTP